MATSSLASAVVFAALLACAMGFSSSPIFVPKSMNNLRTVSSLKTTIIMPKLRLPLSSRSPGLSSISMQAKSPIISSIDKVVKENKIIVFMKGTKDFPQCGFSNTVVQILKSSGAQFETVNVLENPLIRQGIKEYTNWPTIPQVFVGGEFIGGCDIVTEMYQSGELQELLEKTMAE